MAAASASLALAVLSKGIAALVLIGGTLVLHMLVTRDLRHWRRWHLHVTIPAVPRDHGAVVHRRVAAESGSSCSSFSSMSISSASHR